MNIKVGDFVTIKPHTNMYGWYAPFINEYRKNGSFKVEKIDSIYYYVKTDYSEYPIPIPRKYLIIFESISKEERVLQKIKQMYSNSKVPLERKWAESMS